MEYRFNDSAVDQASLSRLMVCALASAGFDPEMPTALLQVPAHKNIGDHLITLGEIHLLSSVLRCPLVHIGSDRDLAHQSVSRVPTRANVLLHGGGNLGDLYPQQQKLRLEITRLISRPANVIWMPQSVHFSGKDGPLIAETREVLRTHRPTVLLRDDSSMSVWQTLFEQEAILCPDPGFVAQVKPLTPVLNATLGDAGVFSLFRRDQESTRKSHEAKTFDWDDSPTLGWWREVAFGVATRIVRKHPQSRLRRSLLERWSFNAIANRRVDSGISLLGDCHTVHTDRLHAAILALLLGKSTIAHDNSYGKVSAVLRTWRSYLDPSRSEVVGGRDR